MSVLWITTRRIHLYQAHQNNLSRLSNYNVEKTRIYACVELNRLMSPERKLLHKWRRSFKHESKSQTGFIRMRLSDSCRTAIVGICKNISYKINWCTMYINIMPPFLSHYFFSSLFLLDGWIILFRTQI